MGQNLQTLRCSRPTLIVVGMMTGMHNESHFAAVLGRHSQ